MTFQAYLDTIKKKTGLGPDDFRRLATERGYDDPAVGIAEVMAWLKDDYGLGVGHSMAIVGVLGKHAKAGMSQTEKASDLFSGAKAHWKPVYDALLDSLRGVGPVDTASTNTYLSLLKGTKKFAIVQLTAARMDVGIKLKGTEPTERFAASGTWNSMVTHRVGIPAGAPLDDELLDWLRRAYDAA